MYSTVLMIALTTVGFGFKHKCSSYCSGYACSGSYATCTADSSCSSCYSSCSGYSSCSSCYAYSSCCAPKKECFLKKLFSKHKKCNSCTSSCTCSSSCSSSCSDSYSCTSSCSYDSCSCAGEVMMSYPTEAVEVAPAPAAEPAPALKEAPKKAEPAPVKTEDKPKTFIPVKNNVFKTVAYSTAAPTYVAEPIVLYQRN